MTWVYLTDSLSVFPTAAMRKKVGWKSVSGSRLERHNESWPEEERAFRSVICHSSLRTYFNRTVKPLVILSLESVEMSDAPIDVTERGRI